MQVSKTIWKDTQILSIREMEIKVIINLYLSEKIEKNSNTYC